MSVKLEMDFRGNERDKTGRKDDDCKLVRISGTHLARELLNQGPKLTHIFTTVGDKNMYKFSVSIVYKHLGKVLQIDK